jgi:hypothetical protein
MIYWSRNTFITIVIKIPEYGSAYAFVIGFKNTLSSSYTLFYNLELQNIIKCGAFLDVLNNDQLARKVSATQSALRDLNNHSSNP